MQISASEIFYFLILAFFCIPITIHIWVTKKNATRTSQNLQNNYTLLYCELFTIYESVC